MNASCLHYLNQLATYFKVQGIKLSLDANSIPVCTNKNKVTTGFMNTALSFIPTSQSNLYAKIQEEKALIYQWLEYIIVYCTNVNSRLVIKELNDIFVYQTYLVNDRVTIADILLYYAVYNIMESLSYLEKEKCVHVCRWFDNMQQDKQLRQKNKMIDFSTNYLASIAPARH